MIGGGASLAFLTGTTITTTITSVLGPALGVAGLAGLGLAGLGLMTSSDCGGRFRCRAPTGQCCLLAQDQNLSGCNMSPEHNLTVQSAHVGLADSVSRLFLTAAIGRLVLPLSDP